MLETETIYPGGNLPKQKYLKRMWRGLAVFFAVNSNHSCDTVV